MLSRKRVQAPRNRDVSRRPRKMARTVTIPRNAFNPYSGPAKFKSRTTLRYADYFTLNPVASGFAVYVLSANGMFDPNISGVGHQPRGFDQWMTMYKRYTVIGSKITIVCGNTSTATTSENILVSCFPTMNTSVSLTQPYDMIEPKGTKWMAFTNGSTISTIKPNPKLTNQINILKWLGKKDTDDDTISGLSSTNPDSQVYWMIVLGLDGSTDIAGINFTAEIS